VESVTERTHGSGDPCHFRIIERLEPVEGLRRAKPFQA